MFLAPLLGYREINSPFVHSQMFLPQGHVHRLQHEFAVQRFFAALGKSNVLETFHLVFFDRHFTQAIFFAWVVVRASFEDFLPRLYLCPSSLPIILCSNFCCSLGVKFPFFFLCRSWLRQVLPGVHHLWQRFPRCITSTITVSLFYPRHQTCFWAQNFWPLFWAQNVQDLSSSSNARTNDSRGYKYS